MTRSTSAVRKRYELSSTEQGQRKDHVTDAGLKKQWSKPKSQDWKKRQRPESQDRDGRLRKSTKITTEKDASTDGDSNYWRSHRENTVCFFCRERGHQAAQCRKNPSRSGGRSALNGKGRAGMFRNRVAKSICYRCGSNEHSLKACARPIKRDSSGKEVLEYAVCFVCNEKGHLTGSCPQNPRGVYPNGGCCKVCSKVDHLAKNCPDQKSNRGDIIRSAVLNAQELAAAALEDGNANSAANDGTAVKISDDMDAFHLLSQQQQEQKRREQQEKRERSEMRKRRKQSSLGNSNFVPLGRTADVKKLETTQKTSGKVVQF